MAAETETTSPPKARKGTNKATDSKEVVEDKPKQNGEESKADVPGTKGDSEPKDEGSAPAAPGKEKGAADSSETKTSEGQETTADPSSTPNYPQVQPQQPLAEYVPPYRAIVRGLTGDAVGQKEDEAEDSKATYRDCSKMTDPIPDGRNRGGVMEVFPVKLHRMLRQTEFEGKADIVSFCTHGRAFNIHKPKRFEAEVMNKFFRQSRVQSFQRQLNLYGFKRISRGPDTGGYYHELFLRGRPGLCVNMQRTRIKGVPKQPDDPDNEPDFYSLPTMPDTANFFPKHIPVSNMAPPPMFPSYMYPMPAGVAGPYTMAQTQPPGLHHPYAAAQFGMHGAPPQSMPPPYGAFPFPYSMLHAQQPPGQALPEHAIQTGEIKPPEKTDNVDIILGSADVSQKVDV
ncbi:MAG: hypothetical protein SGBAC_007565 [Bacillariaceae sp.]